MKKMLATVLVCIILILTVLFVSGVLGYGGKENQPPYEPGDPYPADGSTAVNINVDLSWTGGDPDPDDVVTYDVYFGTTSPPPQAISNQSDTFYDPGVLDFETTFYWQIIAWDDNGSFTEGPVWMFTTGKNQPPYQPTITCGPTAGGPRINLDFSAISPDPEGDQLYYMWDWDDGDFSDWLGPYTFGETITTRYSWINDGEYEIKVKAKDTGEHESEWSEPYLVSISKQIEIDNLKPGFVYFNIFIFDKPYAFISVLEPWGLSIVISTNGLLINAIAAEAVHSVKFVASNLPNGNQQWTVTDTNVSDDFNAYLDIPSGFYKTTAYAYDQNGNMIDSHTRDKVILIQLAS